MASFLDDLREAEEETLNNARLTIEVPRSRMVVRFRPHPGGRRALTPYIAIYKNREALSPEDEVQLIVDCCEEILRRDNDGQIVSYEPDPLTFNAGDERWTEADDPPKTARECVRRLYRLDEQPGAAAGTADALMGWLQGLIDGTPGRVEGNSISRATDES